MRLTITISEDLLAEAQKISGKSRPSEAIVTSVEEYVALRKRLALLEDLFNHAGGPPALRQPTTNRASRSANAAASRMLRPARSSASRRISGIRTNRSP